MQYYNNIDPKDKIVSGNSLVKEIVLAPVPEVRRFSKSGSLGHDDQTLTGNVGGRFDSKKFSAGISANLYANKQSLGIESYGVNAEYRPNNNISLRADAYKGRPASAGINYRGNNNRLSADAEVTKDNYNLRANYAASKKLALNAEMSKGNKRLGLMYAPTDKVAVNASIVNDSASAGVQYTPSNKFTAGFEVDKNGPKANARFNFKAGGLLY
jgi:hypothetical protein